MTAIQRLVLPFPPSGNHAVKHTRSGHHYKTTEARRFETTVAHLARAAKIRPLTGELEATAIFYRGERNGRLVRGDLDDLEKLLWDSLQGYAYENDSWIRAKHTYLREDRDDPRVEVTVSKLEEP